MSQSNVSGAKNVGISLAISGLKYSIMCGYGDPAILTLSRLSFSYDLGNKNFS